MKFGVVVAICGLALPSLADEGLWLFNQFPKEQVKQRYGFELTENFLEHLRLSSVRVGGGTGAFVSPAGLILTNHHLATGCLGSSLQEGFYADSRSGEKQCPGLEVEVLAGMEDVTRQVKEEGKLGAKAAEVLQRRNAAMARVEKACTEKTGNHCVVVKLFSGERYDLYQYKKYSDVRLVFAPELGIAFFGGDFEHSTYQRYDLDIAFLRAYEGGRPASTPQFLKWSTGGVKDGDLVFSAGNPGATSRLATAAQLTFYRDYTLPIALARLQTRIEALRVFAGKSAENRRAAERLLSEFGNQYKSTAGKLIGLREERLLARKQNFERKLRSSVEHDPKLGTDAGKVWDEVATAYKNWTPMERPFEVLERPAAQGSVLFHMARQIVRLAEERAKPNEQRLPEYRDSALASLEASLNSPEPIDEALEVVMVTHYLEELKALGDKEAPLKAILGSKTPQQVGEELVHSSKLQDVAERKRLAADRGLVTKSEDGMIRLARLLEDASRKLLKKHEETIEALEASSSERIAQYRFKVFGVNDYPDATLTPRVTFGTVKAYRDKTEAPVPFATTFGGLYHLADLLEPYKLPARWLDGKASVDMVMPFNFVSTADSAGGNSGNPAVNQNGDLIGISFDGNIESLSLTYLYSDEQARAVHAATQGIVEALRKLYKTPALLQELGVPAS